MHPAIKPANVFDKTGPNPYNIPNILLLPTLLLSIPTIQNIPIIADIMHKTFIIVSFSFNNNGAKNITIIGAI